MNPPLLQLNKLKQAISWRGADYVFKRVILDEFKEATEDTELIATVRGIYCEKHYNVIQLVAESATSANKNQPQIISLLDESTKSLAINDLVEVPIGSGQFYKVAAPIEDIGNLGYFAMIVLEARIDEFPI